LPPFLCQHLHRQSYIHLNRLLSGRFQGMKERAKGIEEAH
jgi:hypothetical protein